MSLKILESEQLLATARAVLLTADDDLALKIGRDALAALAVSGDGKVELELKADSAGIHPPRAGIFGIPCIVAVSTPFGCYCLVPPGGDC